MPSKRSTIAQSCAYCGSLFFPLMTARYKRNSGQFCSRTCSGKAPGRSTLWLPERFWSRVDRNGPVPSHCPERGACWVWTGSHLQSGYGEITSPDSKAGLSHRRAWEIVNGEIVGGLHVLHHCDNPPCVRADPNPAISHLFLGTHRDNMMDKVAKGRHRGGGLPGELHPKALISNAQATEIRRRYAAGGINQADLGAPYGVSQYFVSDVIRRKTYREAE